MHTPMKEAVRFDECVRRKYAVFLSAAATVVRTTTTVVRAATAGVCAAAAAPCTATARCTAATERLHAREGQGELIESL